MRTASFELGAAAYEKRGIAVMVPRWNDAKKCIQCNQCAYAPRTAIRPFVTDEEVAAAPASAVFKDAVE